MARQVPAVPKETAEEHEPVRYVVTGAAAVIRKGTQWRYLSRGASFGESDIDPEHLEHLLEIAQLVAPEGSEESDDGEEPSDDA